MGAAKRIKCCYCEHKGHSILEEYTPFYAYIICFIAYLVLGLYSLVILPCILGIFRDQKHRCPKCHNEIKEDSIFSCLDDNIISFNIGTFGVLVTRRTLIQALLGISLLGLATLAWDVVIEGPSWYLDGKDANPDITWADFVKDCGNAYSNNINSINKQFASKYKNEVVEWEGRVLRVDGDHEDQDEDPVLQINGDKDHYQTHNSAEIMIRMDPPLKGGVFYSSDYDLLLVMDSEHFMKNREALDRLKVGSDIKFKGFLRNLGKADDQYRGNNKPANSGAESDDKLMPWFTTFEIEVVREVDELPTDNSNRKRHHHQHKDIRYSVTEDRVIKPVPSSPVQVEDPIEQ